MNHYVYQLTSNRDGRKYIGVRSCDCPIEEDTYMSSSTEDREYVKDSVKEILRTFLSREEANAFEIALHDIHDVGNNPNFFNKAKSTSTGFCTLGNKEVAKKIALSQLGENNNMAKRRGKLHPNYGKQLPEETREKIRKKALGRKPTKDTKEKMSESHKGRNNYKARPANIYSYDTNELIAENIIISEWAEKNGFVSQHIAATARNKRKQHKGIYARYINDNDQITPKDALIERAFYNWWNSEGEELSKTLTIEEICKYLFKRKINERSNK